MLTRRGGLLVLLAAGVAAGCGNGSGSSAARPTPVRFSAPAVVASDTGVLRTTLTIEAAVQTAAGQEIILMIYTRVLNRGGRGVGSPADRLSRQPLAHGVCSPHAAAQHPRTGGPR
jgi:hypothetical protein